MVLNPVVEKPEPKHLHTPQNQDKPEIETKRGQVLDKQFTKEQDQSDLNVEENAYLLK